MTFNPLPILEAELNLPSRQIAAVLLLLEDGNTVPFIARYRKEVTGALDEVQIRTIQERSEYLRELEDRRETVLKTIESQGKLTDSLKAQIEACETKTALEDLYLPYKPKRRTRAQIAREKGLEPLADAILEQLAELPDITPFIDAEKEVADADAAWAGARDIVAEKVAEDAGVRGYVRDLFASQGVVVSKKARSVGDERTKFEQYYEFSERVVTIPSHRYLAIRRGASEGILDLEVWIEPEPVIDEICSRYSLKPQSPLAKQLSSAIDDAYNRLLATSIETDVRVDLKMRSDEEAVKIFADNLRSLLLASPLGGKAVIGIDPGFRSGCKCVALDETGKYLETVTIYPTLGTKDQTEAEHALLLFIAKYKPNTIAVGNGTAGRETEQFARRLVKAHNLDVQVVQVNESGASIYSASDVAREEFPDLDLTIRGAISIGRRLQDPLAELVKIDPKSIGVGQYQHDVFQTMLQQKLADVVEDCVNKVGVELNTASAPLLSYVSGIGMSAAKKIVKERDSKGSFSGREALLKVPGVGQKTFEQAAGFLRVRGGDHPLDASAVHPERYGLVEQMAKDLGCLTDELIGDGTLIAKVDKEKYLSDSVGTHTLDDIITELKKPGRDPRKTFEAPAFRDDVMEMKDLKKGMSLEGVVTNVTAFGAFVDVGVHQDGLVHIKELANHFVKDPSDIVKAGDKLKVKVLDVDLERKRISLSARGGNEVRKPAPVRKASFSANPFAGL